MDLNEDFHASRSQPSQEAGPPLSERDAAGDADQGDVLAPHGLRPDREARPASSAQPAARKGMKHGRDERRWHPLAIPAGLLLAAVVGGSGYLYMNYAGHFETTDDAFIAARQFTIAPQVSGYITSVPVTDNEHVAAGAVIARIDDRGYRIALARAEAQVAAAQASIQNNVAQTEVQNAQVAQSQAQVQQAQAALTFAQQQAIRYVTVARSGAGTVQNAQQWESQFRQQEATLKTAQAGLVAATRQLAVLKAERSSSEASLAETKAQRAQATLNLSYTRVIAAQPGRVVQLSAGVGAYASADTDLAEFVPDKIWVTANFKETQLDHMRPGQPATIHIDAYPDRTIHGHVASVQPGSGTAFSLLPPENATGNYVKIVQRVPVKIVMDDPPADLALGPGMSVEPTVRVNPSPSLFARLRAWL
jgi:membrane fusion protein (multidrug efflux system)